MFSIVVLAFGKLIIKIWLHLENSLCRAKDNMSIKYKFHMAKDLHLMSVGAIC